MNMRFKFFTSLLSVLVILCLQDVNAEYCPDDVTAGKCFRENIVPFVIGATTTGFVFGFFLLILSLCLFCKTKVKNDNIDWVREIQNLGIVNNGHHLEPRKQGLGDNKPHHFVSDRSLYSERATTSAFPSSNASDIMSAMDEIQDEESRAPSHYYWAYGSAHGSTYGGTPGSAHDDALPQKEKGSEYETITSSKSVHSAQILHHKKSGSKMTKHPSSDASSIAN